MSMISVIVPVYKAEKFINVCVESILEQSFSDLELLLIDDGSPDRSGDICEAFAKKDTRVRVIHKENGGVSSARNLGIQEARGQYIAFVDADDWLALDALEVLHKQLKESGADTAGCTHYNIYQDGEKSVEPSALRQGVYDEMEIEVGLIRPLFAERLGKPNEVFNGFIWRFLYTKEIIVENEIVFAGAYLEDELFLLEYFFFAKRLAMTEDALYYYLQNPQSVTRKHLPTYMDTFMQFMQEKEKLASRFGLEQKYPLWEAETLFAGLLIAIGNEYAKGNPKNMWQKRKTVKELVGRSDMQYAMQAVNLEKLGRNKKFVATLLRHQQYVLLDVLYTVKNLM